MLEQAAFCERVTVKYLSIYTSSPAMGTVAPGAPPEVADQVDGDDQSPEATEKRSAACISKVPKIIKISGITDFKTKDLIIFNGNLEGKWSEPTLLRLPWERRILRFSHLIDAMVSEEYNFFMTILIFIINDLFKEW
jgi:hypothetical protein